MIKFKKQIKLVELKMLLFARTPYKRAEYLKKHKVFYRMGSRCFYQPRLLPSEPFLVSFHDNVYISAGVRFITHDVSGAMLANHPLYKERIAEAGCRYFMDKIEILDNVMVGADAIIMPGVRIGPDAVVAAGSVVTKNVEKGEIVGGAPAKHIGSFYDLAEKRIELFKTMPKKTDADEVLLDYFWKRGAERP